MRKKLVLLFALAATALPQTQLDYPSRLTRLPRADPRTFQFVATNGITATADLSATGGHAVAFAPCPLGVNSLSDIGHVLSLYGGTGTAELVTVNGGSCRSGASSGTISFNTVNIHTGAWKLGSATSGIQEAYCSVPATGGTVELVGGQPYVLQTPATACGRPNLLTIINAGVVLTGGFGLYAPDAAHGVLDYRTFSAGAGTGGCPAGQFATAVNLAGAPTCSYVDYSQLANPPPAQNVNLRLFGAACNNVTDDTVAIQAVIDARAGTPTTFFLPGTCYIPGGLSRIQPYTTFQGTNGSGFRGTTTADGGLPTTRITVAGALIGSAVPYGSTIAPNTAIFPVTNSFASGDLLLLSNYPTDPAGSDSYTTNPDTSRCYSSGTRGSGCNTTDPRNVRQNRRREVVQVRDATSSQITLYSPVAHIYGSTAGLQFQKITPAESISFQNVSLDSIFVGADLFHNFSYRGGKAVKSWVSVSRGLFATIDPDLLDAQNTDSAVSVGGSARFVTIRGNYQGGRIYSDNSLIRIDQGLDVQVIATISGNTSPVGNFNGVYGVLVDTNYFESPDGYTDVSSKNISIKVVSESNSPLSVTALCDPFSAPIYNLTVDAVSQSSASSVYFKGVIGGAVNLQTPGGGLELDSSSHIRVSGYLHGLNTGDAGPDPRGILTSNIYNDNIDFQGAKFLFQPTDTGLLMFFNIITNLRLSDVEFDFSQVPAAFNPIQFSQITNLYIGNVTTHLRSAANSFGPAQTSTLYSDQARPVTGEVRILGDISIPLSGTWPIGMTRLNYLQLGTSNLNLPAQPTCDVNSRWLLWPAPNGGAAADNLQLCSKNSAGNYQWLTISLH